MKALTEKVDRLEDMMMRLVYIQQKTEMEIQSLKKEMKEFKDEMKNFKDEMLLFKDNVEKEHKRMNKQWGELANKMGTLVEDIISPGISPIIKKYFNCEITDLQTRRKKKKKDIKDEFDVIAVSDDCKAVFLVEVKSYLKKEYIDEFINKKVERFKLLFPEYTDFKLYLFIGSLVIPEDILNYLTKNGVYGLAYREWEYLDILNFDQMKNSNQTIS